MYPGEHVMKNASRKFAKILVSSALLVTLMPIHAAETYSFGIVPQTNGSKLSKLWSPFLKYVEENTDIKLRFATTRNISTFQKRLAAGRYDIVYMNPYHYTQFSEQQGYQAFAKAKKKRLKGIIVVQKDSPYKTIDDLDNAEMAFPSHAFAANLVPRAIFNKNDISFSAKYVSSHDSVYRNIAKGRYAAGGGVMRTFRNAPKEFSDKLRILWKSDGYTPHAFAAHPRVPKHVVEKLQNIMLNMDINQDSKKLLKTLRLKGIEKGSDKEWDDVRALNIES